MTRLFVFVSGDSWCCFADAVFAVAAACAACLLAHIVATGLALCIWQHLLLFQLGCSCSCRQCVAASKACFVWLLRWSCGVAGCIGCVVRQTCGLYLAMRLHLPTHVGSFHGVRAVCLHHLAASRI